MLINKKNIDDLFTSFSTAFNKGLSGAQSCYKDISMVIPSTSRETNYGWLGQFPKLREWVGDRVVQNLTAHNYVIENKKYESTISVQRDEIEDDQYGIFSPILEEMGRVTQEHPDELIFKLLKTGFMTKCYDGQYFFDTDHPVKDETGADVSVSNNGGGAETAWYMLDCSRAMRPLIFQERIPYKFSALDNESDPNVFWKDEYVYGVRARANAGFGLWQLAYASKQTLDHTAFSSARAAMRGMKGDAGRPLGIKPTHLVVPPSLEEPARAILEADTRVYESDAGVTSIGNTWRGSMTLIVSEWL